MNTSATTARRPIAAEDYGRPSDTLVRAVAALVLNRIEKRGVEQYVQQHWPKDEALELMLKAITEPNALIHYDPLARNPHPLSSRGPLTAAQVLKAATSPATTTTSGWASQLAGTAVADFLLNLGPASAGSQLLKLGPQFTFGAAGAILVPGAVASADKAAFVTEGSPIPVEQLALSGPTLTPRKFGTISVFTRELFEHSTPTIESFVRLVLSESIGIALDTALFDATAGDATRPAGLRDGISATTASTATPDTDAMYEDLSTLVGAVAPVAGASPIIIVASPRQAAAIKLRHPNLDYTVLASNGLAAGIVLAVASNALVSAVDPLPRVDMAADGALHLEDAAPLAIAPTPMPITAPVRSLFQTDTLGIRLRMELSWALRTTSGLAWTQAVAW
jgi:hypothetical protein